MSERAFTAGHPMTRAHEWIVKAAHLLVLTGAGVSAESGVPTFRDAQTGLWARYDPLELATPEAFARDPALVWRWYAYRRELVAAAQPNAAHQALARWQTQHSMTLVTQNVDGLHARAGSRDVIELHGNLFENRWVGGCGRCEANAPPASTGASTRVGPSANTEVSADAAVCPPTGASCVDTSPPGTRAADTSSQRAPTSSTLSPSPSTERASPSSASPPSGSATKRSTVGVTTPRASGESASTAGASALDASAVPPQCRYCGALMRPAVVWFGESLPERALESAYAAARRADVCLVVGTSGMVYPAAGLPGVAAEHGARVIIVNPQRSDLDHDADIVLYQTAAQCLPMLLSA